MKKAARDSCPPHSATLVTRETHAEEQEKHPEFLRGVIRLFIIQQTMQKPACGYAIRKALQQHGSDLSPGTLYPLLHTWEDEGLLKSYTEHDKKRVRVYYQATDTGKSYYTQARSAVTRLMGKDLAPALHVDQTGEDAQIETVAVGFFA
ncbi:MAG: PadR family transcriptional regulator [Deltaproteobacteria bacterium]|nr:PadR family transcriptional regulator [Deltaproteobacteria bacterium]